MKKLTPKEIYERMKQWRNMKKMYETALRRIEIQEELIATQKEQIKLLGERDKMIETLLLRIEELEEIIFKRRTKKDSDEDNEDDDNEINEKKGKSKKPRTKQSYRREKPKESEVTSEKEYKIDECPDCKTALTRKKICIFYKEDIPLPDKDTQLKEVIKYEIEKGYCPKCKKWHSAIPIAPQGAIIGNKVRIFICYLSILLRLSFTQIQQILWDMYHFKISKGEIRNILFQSAVKLRPIFEEIKERLQKQGVHLDETSWGKFYLWVMVAIKGEEVIYLAGRTRGKGNAEELLGSDFKKVRVSDDYAAYLNLPGIWQRCWAHPHTKLKKLAKSNSLTKEKKEHCQKAYRYYSEIYEELRGYLSEDFNAKRRVKQKKELMEKIYEFREFDDKDPQKLHNIKEQFWKKEDEWLTCMDYEGVPCDNNKAERYLRHMVLKRKISFGNKSEDGSRAFEVNASVLMTYWKKFKDSLFPELQRIYA